MRIALSTSYVEFSANVVSARGGGDEKAKTRRKVKCVLNVYKIKQICFITNDLKVTRNRSNCNTHGIHVVK